MNDDDRTAELLARALAEQAEQVEPDPAALEAIQRRIGSASRPSRSMRRPWVLGALGAGLATAAVITTVVLVSEQSGGGSPAASDRTHQSVGVDIGTDSGPTGQTSATVPPITESVPPPVSATVPLVTETVPQPGALHDGVYDPNADPEAQKTLYYVGPQPTDPTQPPRLFAETHTVTDGTSPLAAVHELLTSRPIDPDLSSGWPAGTDVSAITQTGGVTTIALVGDAGALGTTPHRIPFCLCREAAIQALLVTAGVHGPAAFTVNGAPVGLLLYTDVSPTVSTQTEMETRAWVSIDNIVDGQPMTNPVTVLVSGNTFEGNVVWELTDGSGTMVRQGHVTTAMGSWQQVSVHLGALDRVAYTFTAYEASAKDGARINVDDKAFTVE